jgi:hypothetical protein
VNFHLFVFIFFFYISLISPYFPLILLEFLLIFLCSFNYSLLLETSPLFSSYFHFFPFFFSFSFVFLYFSFSFPLSSVNFINFPLHSLDVSLISPLIPGFFLHNALGFRVFYAPLCFLHFPLIFCCFPYFPFNFPLVFL